MFCVFSFFCSVWFFAEFLLARTQHCTKGSVSPFWKTGRGAQVFLIPVHADAVCVASDFTQNQCKYSFFLVVNQTLSIHRLIVLSLTFKIIDKQP